MKELMIIASRMYGSKSFVWLNCLGTNNGSNANNTTACNGINGDNSVLAGNQVYFDDFTYFCCVLTPVRK
ncbi:MAG: hypothetical protein U0T81_00870 [Saprospiraceae bacterium]